MSDIRQSADDEIDLLELFGTIWDAKWTILLGTVSALAVGLAASFAIPKTYTLSTPIKPAADSVFIDLLPIASFKKKLTVALDLEPVTKNVNDLADNQNEKSDLIDGKYVLDAFVSEFNDYEEMLQALRDRQSSVASSEALRSTTDENLLRQMAIRFKISAPAKPEGAMLASFVWPDADEGRDLLQSAINLTLENTKAQILEDVGQIANQIEKENLNKIKTLNSKLGLILGNARIKNLNRIFHLEQQSKIALELGMAGPEFMNAQASNTTYFFNSDGKIQVENRTDDYLRGYRAINKEIELLKIMTDDEMVRLMPEFADISSEIEMAKLDPTPATIADFVSSVKDNKVENWVDVNLASAEVKSNVRLVLTAAISLILGGMLSIIAVLISKAMRERKAAQVPH